MRVSLRVITPATAGLAGVVLLALPCSVPITPVECMKIEQLRLLSRSLLTQTPSIRQEIDCRMPSISS